MTSEQVHLKWAQFKRSSRVDADTNGTKLMKSVSGKTLLMPDLPRFYYQRIRFRTTFSDSGFASPLAFWHQLVNNCF